VTQTVLSVPDISCDHCARTVTNALTPLAGVERVAVDVPAKRVTVDYDPVRVDVAKMSAVLAEEDYPVAVAEGVGR
jgi:copper chaperone CopZ